MSPTSYRTAPPRTFILTVRVDRVKFSAPVVGLLRIGTPKRECSRLFRHQSCIHHHRPAIRRHHYLSFERLIPLQLDPYQEPPGIGADHVRGFLSSISSIYKNARARRTAID